MLSNKLLMPEPVEDVSTATGQEKSQINSEPLVSQDHWLFAMIAPPDNQPTDIHASNAQPDKFKFSMIKRDATDQLALKDIKSPLLLIISTVEDARHADGHNTCQMLRETNASSDQELPAMIALPDNQMMDTHALLAQLDPSKIQTKLTDAMSHNAEESMTLDWLSTIDHAEDAKPANGQDKFQTMRRLLVSTDHLLNAQTASLEDQLITTLANNAHSIKFKTQLTWEDASLEPAMVLDKSNNHMTLRAAVSARLADGQHSCQTSPRLNALLDHLPSVTAERNNQLMDILASHAQLVPSKA